MLIVAGVLVILAVCQFLYSIRIQHEEARQELEDWQKNLRAEHLTGNDHHQEKK